MPKYIIERNIPGVEKLSARDKQAAAMKSLRTLKDLGSDIQWVHSYVSEGKTHCIYLAPNEEMIYEHGRRSGFSVNKISKIDYILEPITAEEN